MALVEERLGHRFEKRRDLLREALTSGAYAAISPELVPHHGRLAFLGDAVLYLVVTEDRLRRLPPPKRYEKVAQADLTKARKSTIENQRLVELARSWGLALPTLDRQSGDGGKGEATRLATTMEAIIGALWEDTGRDLDTVARILLPHLPAAAGAPGT